MKDYLLAPRPKVLNGYTIRLETPCGTLYLTLNEYKEYLFEMRLTMGKAGNCTNALLQSIALLLSVLLQSNIPRDKIVKTIENRFDCYCPNAIWKDGVRYASCIDFILKKMLEDMLAREKLEVDNVWKKKKGKKYR